MSNRSSERGNTILIATVLVLGLTLTSLGLAKYVRNYAQDAAYIKDAGFPSLQAFYAAEMGINHTLWRNNSPVVLGAPDITPLNQTTDTVTTYSPTQTITRQVGYDVTYLGQTGANYNFRSVGRVSPALGQSNFQTVSRSLSFAIRHNGTNWVLESYAYD